MAANNKDESTGTESKANQETRVPAISVIAMRDGFYRAGRRWSNSETVVPLSELTKEQIRQLEDEPALIVSEVEIEA